MSLFNLLSKIFRPRTKAFPVSPNTTDENDDKKQSEKEEIKRRLTEAQVRLKYLEIQAQTMANRRQEK